MADYSKRRLSGIFEWKVNDPLRSISEAKTHLAQRLPPLVFPQEQRARWGMFLEKKIQLLDLVAALPYFNARAAHVRGRWSQWPGHNFRPFDRYI